MEVSHHKREAFNQAYSQAILDVLKALLDIKGKYCNHGDPSYIAGVHDVREEIANKCFKLLTPKEPTE
jgi:hypothetical protein